MLPSVSDGLADVAYHRLRKSILDGEIAPGAAIFELHVAERLGMSRTPVREALKLLSRDGFVEPLPSRGYIVPRPTVQSIRELFELRETLEGMAARYAAQRAVASDLALLDGLHDEYERRVDDWNDWTRIGNDFHNAITAAARNERLTALLGSLNDQIVMSRRTALRGNDERQKGAIDEHRALLAAIRARDGDRAEALGRAHVRLSYEATLKAFQDGR